MKLENIYEQLIWTHSEEEVKDFFVDLAENEDKLNEYIKSVNIEGIDEETLKNIILRTFTMDPVSLVAEVTIKSCYSVLGVEIIRDAVAESLKMVDNWKF